MKSRELKEQVRATALPCFEKIAEFPRGLGPREVRNLECRFL
jgi:hypothetical protein